MKTMNSAALQVKNNSKNKYSLLRPNSKILKKNIDLNFTVVLQKFVPVNYSPVTVCVGGAGAMANQLLQNF